ncbi:MAG: OB-fold domain-containing protein [Steroidobacteraceae bacterium]
MTDSQVPLRALPQLTPENIAFWTGGEREQLLIYRCMHCRAWFHPPAPVCPTCLSRDVHPQSMPRHATLMSHTVNHQRWLPGMSVPYVIAIGSMDAAPDVHLMAELVNCPASQIRSDMPLEVVFLHEADVWIPQFRPLRA